MSPGDVLESSLKVQKEQDLSSRDKQHLLI